VTEQEDDFFPSRCGGEGRDDGAQIARGEEVALEERGGANGRRWWMGEQEGSTSWSGRERIVRSRRDRVEVATNAPARLYAGSSIAFMQRDGPERKASESAPEAGAHVMSQTLARMPGKSPPFSMIG
jgi:hypothetical protein